MSAADKDSQDCTMDLSQVEITNVSLNFGLLYVKDDLLCRLEV